MRYKYFTGENEMSHEHTILKAFAEKISTYTLSFDAREELNSIKFQIESSKKPVKLLISHLSSFLHYLYLSLGSNATFIESLIVEMQSILFSFDKKRNIKEVKEIEEKTKIDVERFLSLKHDPVPLIQSEISLDKKDDSLNTASKISVKFQYKKSFFFQEDSKKSGIIKSLRDEQKRLNKNIKFKNFLREVWQYAMSENMFSQKVFISYAWPIKDKYSEKWTKNFIKSLSTHLCQAGVQVYLDEFHSGGGYPLRKFMQNIGNMDHVLVINTKTMSKKLSLEHSGVKYEATQIKKYLKNKDHNFVINILLDKELHSDPDFHEYPQLSFLDENSKTSYCEVLVNLLGMIYHFKEKSFSAFKEFYEEKYKSYKIDADLWHVAVPSAFQVKRRDLIEKTQNSLLPMIILHGQSGSGKSELIRQYVWDNYAQYQTVYWFDASGFENLKNDFVLLMQSKKISIEDDFKFVEYFAAWLKNQKNYLIIFDNWMIEDNSLIEKINAHDFNEKNSALIVTTTQIRTSEIFNKNITDDITVGDYTDEEARTYIRMTLGEQKEEDVDILLILMGKSPYRLACVCGHIQRQSHSIQKFLYYYDNLRDTIFARPLFPIPAEQKVETQNQEQVIEIIEENPLDQFLTLPQESLSEIGKFAQQFLRMLYDRFKEIDYKSHEVLSNIFDHQIGLLFFSEQKISDDDLIKFLDFIVSHLSVIAFHFKILYLTDLILMGKNLLKKYSLKENVLALQKATSSKKGEKPAIVVETQDEISVEMERYQEQNKLDKLTNIEKSSYENSFKLFLNDLWVYALNHQCRSKKIYLFCVLPEGFDDERWWMQSYIENLKKHLSSAGFSVYPEDIAQSTDASEDFLNEMDHVIAISNPTIEKRFKDQNGREFQFNAKIHKIAQQKPERYRLPFLTGKVNHLDKEWCDLAEFSFFKNDYLKELQSLVRTLYGLDQIGGFNTYYKQRLLYHSILNNQWHVPERTQHFIGRETQLEKIEQRFQLEGQQVIVVTAAGMGGVGKTQLTLQYIHLHGHEYQKIYWIHATSADSIKLAYAELAEYLKIPLTEEEQKSIDLKVECVKRALEDKRGWLIIYDNAPDEKTIEKFKPVQGGKILVTSRNIVWNNAVSVEVFTEAEAEKYIRLVLGEKRLQEEIDFQKSLKGLMDISGRLPVALALICAYIQKQNISLQDYVKIYEIERDQLPSQQAVDQTMAVIWKITSEKIQKESPDAIMLISFCSLLHHEGIPEYLGKSFFERFIETSFLAEMRLDGAKVETSLLVEMTLDEAKRVATEYFILKFSPEKRYFSLHSLVQETIKIQLNSEERLLGYLRRSINSLSKICPCGENKNEEIQIKKELLPHLETILKNHYENIEKLSSETYSEQLGDIVYCLSDVYSNLEDMQKQKEVLEHTLPILENHYGKDDFRISIILINLATAYGELEDPQRSKGLFERALTIREKHYGKDSLEVAFVLVSLGIINRSLGDGQLSKKLLKRALSIQEEHYGKDHYEVASTKINLGNTYGYLGDVQKQKELLEHALPILEKRYGENHHLVALTIANLASAHNSLGNTQQSKKLLERALPIIEEHYGKEHYHVANVLTAFGNVYSSLEDTQKSKEFYKKALKIFIMHFGYEDTRTQLVLSNISAEEEAEKEAAEEEEMQFQIAMKESLILSEENQISTPDNAFEINLINKNNHNSEDTQITITKNYLKEKSNNIEMCKQLLLYHYEQASSDKIIKYARILLEADSHNFILYIHFLARAFHIKKEFEEAETYYIQLLYLTENISVQCEYGLLLLKMAFSNKQDRIMDAIDQLKFALNICKNDDIVEFYQMQKEFSDEYMKSEIEKVRVLKLKANIYIHYLLLQCYKNIDDKENIKLTFNKMKSLVEINNTELHHRILFYAYQLLNQKNETKRCVSKSLLSMSMEKFPAEKITNSQIIENTNIEEDTELMEAIKLSMMPNESQTQNIEDSVEEDDELNKATAMSLINFIENEEIYEENLELKSAIELNLTQNGDTKRHIIHEQPLSNTLAYSENLENIISSTDVDRKKHSNATSSYKTCFFIEKICTTQEMILSAVINKSLLENNNLPNHLKLPVKLVYIIFNIIVERNLSGEISEKVLDGKELLENTLNLQIKYFGRHAPNVGKTCLKLAFQYALLQEPKSKHYLDYALQICVNANQNCQFDFIKDFSKTKLFLNEEEQELLKAIELSFTEENDDKAEMQPCVSKFV